MLELSLESLAAASLCYGVNSFYDELLIPSYLSHCHHDTYFPLALPPKNFPPFRNERSLRKEWQGTKIRGREEWRDTGKERMERGGEGEGKSMHKHSQGHLFKS